MNITLIAKTIASGWQQKTTTSLLLGGSLMTIHPSESMVMLIPTPALTQDILDMNGKGLAINADTKKEYADAIRLTGDITINPSTSNAIKLDPHILSYVVIQADLVAAILYGTVDANTHQTQQ